MRWLFLLSVAWLAPARAHHVLCVFPIPSRSHNHLAKGIVHALLDAGHEVTWATPYPGTDKKNLKFIDLSATQALSDAIDMTDERNRNAGLWFVKEFSRNISTAALEHQALRDAVVKGQFDAVVTEWFFSDVDAGYAAVQQVPWILLNGVVMHPYMEHLVDEVRSIPTHPLMFNDFPMPMTLIQRIFNSMMFVLMSVDNWLDYYSKEAYYTSKFGPLASARGVPLPPFSSALHNVSILLVNSHPSLAAPRSLPPNVIDVAGYHIEQEAPPLPKDLQDLLDGSPQGVVYFSMGSVMKSSSLPERTQQALLKVFGGLTYTVLWKFEQELRGAPKNVHVRAWMPQASILAHPNVKLFITHGGLLSTLEATHYGVPLLAIPMFGDQHTNADRSVRAGVARRVTFSPNMAAQVKVEVEEMMTNDRYYKKAKQISKLFHDRPERPSKLVAHYVRLAIDSKGAYHLRSPSKLYAWYERWLLDQLAVLALALGLVYVILRRALRALKNMLFKTNKQKRS